MKSKKGSIAAITLVFALLLMIAGGSWLMLMTTEQTGSSSDEMSQKAWYAAEAGLTRAVTQLKYDNNNWDWLSIDDKFDNDSQIVKNDSNIVQNMITTDKSGDWYAVSITFVRNGEKNYLGATGVEKGNVVGFTITAVGSSGGNRRVIKKEVTIATVEDTSGDFSETPVLPGVVQTGSTLIVENDVSHITGGLYASSLVDSTGGQ